MRDNLNVSALKDRTLGVASSCDLQLFVAHLRKQSLFKDIVYNFETGSSDAT